MTQLYELSNFLRIKASSKLNVWNSSSTSRSKCGFTNTWPTTPNSLTKPNGVQTVKIIGEKILYLLVKLLKNFYCRAVQKMLLQFSMSSSVIKKDFIQINRPVEYNTH